MVKLTVEYTSNFWVEARNSPRPKDLAEQPRDKRGRVKFVLLVPNEEATTKTGRKTDPERR
jgi:hypothetical protein